MGRKKKGIDVHIGLEALPQNTVVSGSYLTWTKGNFSGIRFDDKWFWSNAGSFEDETIESVVAKARKKRGVSGIRIDSIKFPS